MDWEDFFTIIGMMVCVVVGVCVILAAGMYIVSDKGPQLVGIGCQGTQGPIYAYEEDAFPSCQEIRRR